MITPTFTRCEVCHARMAAMPGPMNKLGRPCPPAGYELGYIVEKARRSYAICRVCLDNTLLIAV